MPPSAANSPDLDDLGRFVVSGPTGEYIYEEGAPGAEMYLIQEGKVEILRTYAGETHLVAELGPGDFFGEMSLLEEQPREVAARAAGDYRLLKIDYAAFGQMVREDPEIAVRMLRKLSRRIREREEADLKAQRVAFEVLGGPSTAVDTGPLSVSPEAPVVADDPVASVGRAVLVHRASGKEFPLAEGEETTIGRINRKTGVAPDVDFGSVDAERTLSRSHATIRREGSGLSICEDSPTGNGTFVNGERLRTGVPVKIKAGDSIRFGRVETELEFL